MPASNEIKASARASLKNKWPQAIGIGAILLSVMCIHFLFFEIIILLLYGIVGELFAFLIALGSVILFAQFFFLPILYGALRWFWYSSCENESADIPISEIFCYLSGGRLYLRALSLSFRVFLRVAIICFICFLPSFLIMILRLPVTYELFDFSMPYWAESFWVLGNFLNLLGLAASFLLLLRYFSAPILMINDNNISPQEALHLSVIISKKSNGKTIGFICSFLLWLLLSFLYLPIIFTLPYFLCAYAVFCRFLIKNYNNNINNFSA